MTMNLDRHVDAHKQLFRHLVHGDGDSAEKHREFYDEYLAVMDLTAEFYLQTIDTVFVRHALPKGEMMHRGRPVDPSAIRRVALMTIEGEKDDITGLGQCRAAQDLCSSLSAEKKYHYECPDVGHYGIFNGSRFRRDIAPRIAQFVRTYDLRAEHAATMPPLDHVEAAARAKGHAHEPASVAFTFQVANDCKPDPMVRKLKEHRLGAQAAAVGERSGPRSLPFRWWSMAGSLMIDNMFRLHTTYAGGVRR